MSSLENDVEIEFISKQVESILGITCDCKLTKALTSELISKMQGQSEEVKKAIIDLGEVRRIDIEMYKYISKNEDQLLEKANDGELGRAFSTYLNILEGDPKAARQHLIDSFPLSINYFKENLLLERALNGVVPFTLF
jgi:hypothetical protein